MEFDRPFPRFTRYLRSFTELDLRKPFEPTKTGENEIKKISHQNKEGHLWSELIKKITEKYGQKSDVYKNICQLRSYARELCEPILSEELLKVLFIILNNSEKKIVLLNNRYLYVCNTCEDQQSEVMEETAVMLLKLFLKQTTVLNKHRSILKQSFGDFPSSLPEKIRSVISNISECVLEELGDTLRIQVKSKSAPSKDIWGSDLMYTAPVAWDPPDTSFLFDMVSADSIVDSFSMVYNGQSSNSCAAKPSLSKPTFGMSWLMVEVRNSYNNDNPPGFTVSELCESLISMLSSEKTNDQLQNELFDLLGFERFQLIETLLQHRKDIMRRITIENEKKNPVLTEQKRREPCLSQVVVKSEGEKQLEKQARKEEKKLNKYAVRDQSNGFDDDEPEFDPIDLRNKRIATLSEAVEKKQSVSLERKRATQKDIYPNVYDSFAQAKQQPGFICGVKMVLPEDVVKKDTKQYEEVTIPASEPPPTTVGKNLVPIETLDDDYRWSIEGT